MSREIAEAKNNGGLVSAIDNRWLGEMLKPLIREIHLFDSYISGTSTVPDGSVFDKAAVDDSLTLLREENKFDSNTIVLLNEDKKKLQEGHTDKIFWLPFIGILEGIFQSHTF